MGNNDLSELSGGIFDNLTRLRTLKLSHNDLSELPGGIFDNLTELETLYLHWNRLSELPDGIFDNLTALSSLELSNNELSELPDGLFDDLSELQFLHLSDNELSVLPDRAFDSLTKLWSLSVGGNELSTLPEDVFVNLAGLQSLDLNNNELSELADGIFDGLSELHSLHLNGNELSELPDGIFDNLTKLRTLSVDYNGLSELPDSVFDNLSELWGLSLIGNELSELPDGIFDNLANLKQLYLFSNKLSELPDRIFYGLAILDVLNIDENTGSPFTFTVELERPDENTIALKVAQATPFDMEVTLSAEGGSLSSATVTIPAGNVSSEQITVSPNGAEPVAISVVSAAFLLGEFQQARGIQTGLGDHLTLREDSDTDTPATGAPTISGTAQVGETLTADTSDIADADGLSNATFIYQWLGSRDTEIQGATSATYTLVAEDEGKTIKVRVTFTDNAGNNETLTSSPTAVVSAAPPPPPDNVHAVTQKSGVVELTWQPPDGAAVTGYRIERRRAGGQDSGPQRSHGQPRDHHTLVEDTGNTETSYVDESAEQGVEYEYRVTARNESGPGEESDWVRADPATASNTPATGAPTITGKAQVGETLTADITGISDADGLSGVAYNYQWVSSDGTTDTDIEKATDSTYKLVAADKGNSIKVRVTFTDDGGNEETLTSAATGPVLGDGLPGAPRNLAATPGNKEITLSWEPPADNGNAPATRYRIEWRIDGKDYDKNHWGTSRSTTYTTNDQANLANGVKYFFRVKAENDDGNSYGPYGPASGEVSATPTSGSAVDLGTPVLSDTETLHHGMVRLDWQDIEDAGWYVAQYYHLKGGEWLDLPAEGVDIAFHGSSAVVSNLHGLSWLRVRAMSCAGESEWSQIEQLFGTNKSDWEGVPVPDVEEGDEIKPCPVVLGTPVLSDTEALHHGMVRLDWQDIEDAGWYVVQYYHVKSGEWLDLPAEGVDIAFHGSSAVVSNLHGLSWLRVRAMSCAGESEWSQIEQLFGTNASDWEGVPVPDVAEGDEIKPCDEDADTSDNSPATGAPTISGTVQVGETLTADTSGIADADGLANATFSYQWITDDSVIVASAARTYTPTDGDRGKSIKVRVSFTDDAGNEETLTSANTATVEARANSPATGLPTISGTAQVGETLTANTSGVADVDGLSNVQYEYQWIANDSSISGATNATYTLVAADEGQVIKVRASFTDDAGNNETLTSAGTEAVSAANTPATGAPTISGTAQVGETLTANTSGVADVDGLSNVQYEYRWLANDSGISGATNATYTLVAADEGQVIKVRASFTDDAGNNETLTSAGTAAVSAANTPATGAPTIIGTAQVGEALTVDTSGIADAEGLTNVLFTYQWRADDADINGAIGSTYTMEEADEGKTIKVKVSFTDDADNEETLTSMATTAVAGAAPAISGGPSYITVEVTEDSSDPINIITNFTITWSNDSFCSVGYNAYLTTRTGDETEGSQLHLGSAASGGAQITAGLTGVQGGVFGFDVELYCGTDESGRLVSRRFISTTDGRPRPHIYSSEPPLSALSVSHGTFIPTFNSYTSDYTIPDVANADTRITITAIPKTGYAVEFFESSGNGVSGLAVYSPGASGLSSDCNRSHFDALGPLIELTDADPNTAGFQVDLYDGENHVEVAVYPTEYCAAGRGTRSGYGLAITRAEGSISLIRPNRPPTGLPGTGWEQFNGGPCIGCTLNAAVSHIRDRDGMANAIFSYQWLADDSDIAGATGLTYTLTNTDEGKAIKVEVSFTDDEGNAETLTSAATAAVTAAPPSTTPGEPQNLELTPVAVGTNGVGIKVFWDAPSATGGSDISGYRIQWKGGSQDYPDDRETRQAFLENAPYTIDATSPTPIEGDELTVRVAAVNGAGAGVWTEKVGWLPSHTDLELWLLMKEYADEKQTTFPWVLETWNYLDRYEVPVEVGPTPGLGSVPLLPCVSSYTDGDDGLKECHVEKFKILQIEDPKPRIIIHEMAHAFTLANRVTDAPGPLAIAHLYFDSLNLQGGLRGCEPRELYADVLTMLTLDIYESSYWKTCNGDNAQREAQALDVLRSAVDGEMPQWFADTYTDAEDEPDLERLWTDVQDLPGREWNVVVYQLRDAFGGYCNNRLTWMSMQYSEDKLTQPWMDGGCPPPEPSSLEVTPGDGELTLAWDAPASDGDSDVEGYIVQWKSVYKSYDDWATRRQRAVLDSPTSLTYTISGLGNGAYDVRVRAYNHIGPGQPLDVESVTLSEPVTPNTPATGVPTISGTAQVGETLTVDTSGIADEDGMENGIFTFLWQVYDATGWNVVPTDYEGTYTIEPRDVGMTIYVLVFFVDDAGNGEALLSGATAAVAAAAAAAPTPNSPATGAPTISGTAQVGETLTVDTSGIADADGLGNVQYEYQWLADDSEIAGATSLTYTLVDADEGKAIKVEVSFTDDADNEETLTSPATAAVAARPNSPATGAPTITGTAQVGETLTANTTGVADADGLSNVQYEYQWLADDAEVAGATSLTYTLADADEGKAIKVEVTFTDDAGNGETLTSAATGAVAAEPQTNSPATGAPTITGTVQVGETLTANTSGIADADGLSNVQYEHQWLADDAAIAGAIGSTYILVDVDEGKTIKVRASFADDLGNDEELTSAATDEVDVRPNSPATGAPTISGTAQVGETLTADTSDIADDDGLNNVQYEHQWLADDAEVAGATRLTYTLADADEGKAIKVEVSFTDDAGNEETLSSAATDAVAAEPSEPPDKPKGLDATATHDSVTLTWGAPQDDSITGYVILRRVRVNDQGGDFSVLVANTGSAATTYTDNEVAASTTYTYRIKAINEHGTSERSRWVHIDTSAPPVPDKPTGLEATASHGQVVLTWDDPEDDSITGYVILRRLPGVDPEGQFDELVANTGTAAITYTDDTVAAETRYTYRIKAINEHGVSERSRWVHIDTPAAP